jgi:hypothetical protein
VRFALSTPLPVMPVSPELFVSYWYGIAVRELAQSQHPDATPEQRAALPILRERIRLHERFAAKPLA